MADRDIEQAADLAPPGRGDATQPDPVVKGEAVEAVQVAWLRLLEEGKTPGRWMEQYIDAAVEAAAAVIVPATAEHIAAIKAEAAKEIRQMLWDAVGDYEDAALLVTDYRGRLLTSIQEIAAGLSTDAADE